MKDAAAIQETIYRLDGPLRQVLGEPEALLQQAPVRPGSQVLDVGAGTGYLSLTLARAVGRQGRVHCVDACPELLHVLQGKAHRQGLSERLSLHAGSALRLDFPDEHFDAIFSSYLLHELAEQAPAALREMYRVLRPLGQVVLADFRRVEDSQRCREIEAWYGAQADGGGEREVHLRFSLADMERMLLEAGFRQPRLSTWMDFHMHIIATK